jgi:hypothetical protein
MSPGVVGGADHLDPLGAGERGPVPRVFANVDVVQSRVIERGVNVSQLLGPFGFTRQPAVTVTQRLLLDGIEHLPAYRADRLGAREPGVDLTGPGAVLTGRSLSRPFATHRWIDNLPI